MNVLNFSPDQLLAFLFLLTRCSGIFVFTPFFGSLNIPTEIRVVISVVVSYLFAMNYKLPILGVPWTLLNIAVGLAGELLVGMAIGFVALAMFAGLQFAGQIIGFQIGLSLVNTIDPQTANRSATLSVYQNQIGLMLFLGMNAHHWFIRAIGDSLVALPPFSISINAHVVGKLTDTVAHLFVIGFQIAAPVTVVLLLTDIALGVIGRSAPQIHILVIGFPLKILAGISALGLGLYFMPAAMRGYAARLQQDMTTIIQLLRN